MQAIDQFTCQGFEGFIACRVSANDAAGWQRLINQSATDHSQSVAGGIPILALDMYEHAYHLDFGANAAAYVAAFMRNIDWSAVQTRYEDAIKVAPPPPLVQKAVRRPARRSPSRKSRRC